LKILRIIAMAVLCLAAAAGAAGPVSAAAVPVALADPAPACPNVVCVGERVENTNCGLIKYGVAGLNVVDQDELGPSIADLWYSPLCNTVWGEYIGKVPHQIRYLQLWSQDEYGGRNVRSFQSDLVADGFHETTMVSANGSVKFCVTHMADRDPDLEPNAKPYNNCSAWH
jgi:hypothetical protein